jgi:hypothetical protein
VVQAERTSSERILYLGLLLAHDLLGAPLPEDVLKNARADATVRSLVTFVRESMFLEGDAPRRHFRKYAFHMRLRNGARDRVRYSYHFARTMIAPSETDRSFRLPGGLSFLHWVVRPVRLMGKWAPRAWRSVSQQSK